jgi:hypothetical protein
MSALCQKQTLHAWFEMKEAANQAAILLCDCAYCRFNVMALGALE